MRKQKAPLRDFFSDYNHAKVRGLTLSFMFALLLSVSFVMVNQGVDTRGLMASVSNIANEKVYDADLILESQSGGILDIIFGSAAKSVDTLTFTMLGDPEKFTSLTSDNSRVYIQSSEPGVYTVAVSLAGESIYPGTKIVSLKASGAPTMSIGLVDTTFESAGVKYNLTSKGR